jgi:hypothetical protein
VQKFFSNKKCSAKDCGTDVAEKFALECGDCLAWFHGDCVAMTTSIAAQMDSNALQFICDTCLQEREEMTPCQTRFASPHSNWNVLDNDSNQQSRAISSKKKRDALNDEPKAGPSVAKFAKMSPKLQEGKQVIASSPSSNWSISDNDSGLENLAVSSHKKRQTFTIEPKNSFCLEKIMEKYQNKQDGKQQIASSPSANWNISDNDSDYEKLAMRKPMKRRSKTNEPTPGPSVQKNSKMSRNESEETQKSSLKNNKMRLHRK